MSLEILAGQSTPYPSSGTKPTTEELSPMWSADLDIFMKQHYLLLEEIERSSNLLRTATGLLRTNPSPSTLAKNQSPFSDTSLVSAVTTCQECSILLAALVPQLESQMAWARQQCWELNLIQTLRQVLMASWYAPKISEAPEVFSEKEEAPEKTPASPSKTSPKKRTKK